jgi:hypothetical protein
MIRDAIPMLTLLLAAAAARADPPTPTSAPAPASPPAQTVPPAEKPWTFSLSFSGYIVPDDRDYVQPTFTADRDALHLELRYNYEDLNTYSAWAGYNLAAGEDLTIAFTPMFGIVAGSTDGVAPGYELTLAYGRFELYSESEFLFDFGESSENYFYTWSELSFAPAEWFRLGIAIQRTKVRDSDLDIDRGLLLGFSHENLDFTVYLFNLGWETPTVVLSVGLEF